MARPSVKSSPTATSTRRLRLAGVVLLAALGACDPALDPAAPTAAPTPPPALASQVTPSSVSAIQITSTLSDVCVLKSDNTAVCWDRFTRWEPSQDTYVYIDAGFTTGVAPSLACALKVDGSAACFTAPDGVPPLAGPFTRITPGGRHACALRTDLTIACWGSSFADASTPPSGTFTRLDAGDGFTCAIRSADASLACWGANGGYGLTTPPSGAFADVSGGGRHACAVRTTGALACWGHPDEIAAPSGTFFQVAAGMNHSCALNTSFNLRCWGSDNLFGQQTAPPGQYTQVSVGRTHSCAINTAGKVVCWGASGIADNIPDDIAGPRATTTVLTSSPNPSGLGQSVAFTARVETSTAAATSGSVTFVEGTCSAPGSILASGVSVTAGVASFSTAALTLGSHTLTACYGGSPSFLPSDGGATHVVDPAITTVSVTVDPGTQQYSDGVTLRAAVTPTLVQGAAVTGTVQFRLAGSDVGLPVTLDASGIATLAGVPVAVGAGATTVEAVFTSTSASFNGSSGSTGLTVVREAAAVDFSGANEAALQVSTAGGALNAGQLRLDLTVREAAPDLALAPGTASSGDIVNAGLTVTLVPVGPGTTQVLSCSAGAVVGTGYAAVRPFTCVNPAPVAVNLYEVSAVVTGDHYAGVGSDVVTVFDPSLGFVTGGGTFLLDGDRVRFGLNTKYKNKGSGAKGSFMMVRWHADGTRSTLTSNALAGLAIGEDLGVPMGWAALNGKATYTTWDAVGGAYATVGGQGFSIYVEDRGDPGARVDRVWVGGPSQLNMAGTLATARSNTETLTGGNVSVPHRDPR